MSDHLNKEIVFLRLQYCDEKNYNNVFHWLATNSGFYFDMKYFENAITNGEYDEVEKYFSAFTKFDDNPHSLSIFFEIRKQIYLEALDKPDYGNAAEILKNDLTVLSTSHGSLLDEMTLLLRLPNLSSCRWEARIGRVFGNKYMYLGTYRESFNADTEAIIPQALQTGGGPNVSDAYTFNGLPGPLYNFSSKDTFKLKVKPGKTYLLRFVNDELFFGIPNHSLTVVEADAIYVILE
ncbi:hypothetical protein AgCh_002547 [Apium graveolens]